MGFTITEGRLTKAQARKAQLAQATSALEDARIEHNAEMDYLRGFEEDPSENVGDLADLLLDMLSLIAADKANDASDAYARSQALKVEQERLRKAQEAAVKASADPVRSPGMYRRDGVIYRIQKNRDRGKLYAKKLGPVEFEYIGQVPSFLCESDRMTLEEAKAFGVETGICCVCAALLTDPKSIAAGIGPVCAKRV